MTVKTIFASLALAASAFADGGLYHTTGTVISSDEKTVTIEHGSAKWTFDRGAVLTEPIAVGSTVTIRYHMVADSASVTEPKSKPAAPKPKAKAPEPKPKTSEPEPKKKPATPAKPSKTPAKKKEA
jgi:hypothetical protein